MNTAERLVAAAADLLDEGGQSAVTLRSVSTATGVSHTAAYKHFNGRAHLLAGVARADFVFIADSWKKIGQSGTEPIERLLDALDVIIHFSQDHPARYQLLFRTPDVATDDEALSEAADAALAEFSDIVADCQRIGILPPSASSDLGIVLFSAVHGLIGADASGRLRSQPGWTDVRAGMRFVIDLLHGGPAPRASEQSAPIITDEEP